MGKASSNKKVARAAGTGGGRTGRGRTPWTYYSVILLVVVLGVVGTVASRDHRLNKINSNGTSTPPAVGTVWNEGFGVDVCGKFLPNIKTDKNPNGLTTSGDGIIHIHPTVKSAAGKNATLGKFASDIGFKLNAAELQVPGGKLYRDGDKCNGQPSHVYVTQFDNSASKTGVLQTSDPQDVRLANVAMLTIAFVPASQKNTLPPPPQDVITALNKLSAASTPTTTTTTPPAVSTPSSGTTVPGATTTPTTKPTTATTQPSSATTASSPSTTK